MLLRATLISSITLLLLVGALALYLSNTSHQGAFQNGMYQYVLSSAVSSICILLVFPFSAIALKSKSLYSNRNWTILVLICTGFIALAVASTSVLIKGGTFFPDIYALALMLFLMSLLMLWPISVLWFKLANKAHNKALNTDGLPLSR